jgi:DNA-binding LacI/PurR family transcriptional regulator
VNDETALGVLHAAHEQGFRVGADIVVAGFDGIQDALHTEPPLTTLGIPVAGMACQLVDMLLENVGNTSLAAREIVVQPELLSRASTGL